MKKQATLTRAVEPLQIPFPRGFKGQKSDPDAKEIFISTGHMTLFTLDEIAVIERFLKSLPYDQALAFGGTFIDPDDTLLNCSQEELDAIEKSAGLPSSRKAPGGGEQPKLQRVLLLREQGYLGNGGKALLNSAQA